jgi:hypothetical protein
VLRSNTVDLVEISFKDNGVTCTLPLVPTPYNALEKTPPPPDAPRTNLMLFETSTLNEESPLAEVLRPGVVLDSIEQPEGFLRVRSPADLLSAVKNLKPGAPASLVFSAGSEGKQIVLEEFTATAAPAKKTPFIGFTLLVQSVSIHQNPFEQMGAVFRLTFSSLSALLNRNTDVGANQLMGVISIAKTYLDTDSLPQILWFTILINISLAILNILPIPILDGGHIVFATLQKIRGKPIPPNIHAGIHYVFMLLIVLGMSYVLLNDVKRCSGNNALNAQGLIYKRYVAANLVFTDEKPRQQSAPAQSTPAPAPDATPAR